MCIVSFSARLFFRVLCSRGCELLPLCRCDGHFLDEADTILHSAHKAGCVRERKRGREILVHTGHALYWKEFATDTTVWLFTDG
jgi:hypothetical protein